MHITLKEESSGDKRDLSVSKTDFIVSIKAKCQEIFPSTSTKLIQLVCAKTQSPLEDDKYIGDYKSVTDGSLVEVIIPQTQPYSEVKYQTLLKLLEQDHPSRKTLDKFFDPANSQNEWNPTWNKGNEYVNYPPVDVNNPWSSILPSNTRQIAKQPKPQENNGTSRRTPKQSLNFDEEPEMPAYDAGRTFHTNYTCKSRGYNFELLHRLEGKWSGTATQISLDSGKSNVTVVNCKLMYDPKNMAWVEQQIFTNKSNVSSSRVFTFTAINDGVCNVWCDDAAMCSASKMLLEEAKSNNISLTLTGMSKEKPGSCIFTETIVYNASEDERTRTITRFSSTGTALGIVICKEKRVIDEESGALFAF